MPGTALAATLGIMSVVGHWQEDPRSRRMASWFDDCPMAAIALSGGVDSVLVTALARHWLGRDRVTAYMAVSASLQADNRDDAHAFCQRHDIALVELNTDELDNPAYVANQGDRCYHCKQTLFDTVIAHLGDQAGERWLCTGTNRDDLGDYRPGLRAAAEAGVRAPLAECELGKADVRELAKAMGLAVWAKPASPCLSSRVAYGQPVTREKLTMIEAGEQFLRARGFPVVRVRHHGDLARIEVPADRVADLTSQADVVIPAIQQLGFTNVEIDGEGFVSGKLNRALAG